jgi:hypothetical protein
VDTAEEVSTEASAVSATSAPETALEESKIDAGRSIIVGLILLTIATTMFVLLGGLRWLRRVAAGRNSRYRKLDNEDSDM